MELHLKVLLEQAEFTKTRGGGYDRTEVDDFLDKSVAMAAKVETRLTELIDQNAKLGEGESVAPPAAGPSADEVEAEIERRVAARLAEAPAAGSAGPTEDETAEKVRRTIVMAERTASEAIREAKEDAARLVEQATERATALTAETEERAASLKAESEERAASLTAEAEAHAAKLTAEAQAEASNERQAARNRLALEISALEGSREALRSDVGILERHVEEQRTQLRSTVGELQRLLDDPAGFRLAPTPALLDPELPDFSEDRADTEDAAPAEVEPEAVLAEEEPFDPTALRVEPVGAIADPAPIVGADTSVADLEAEASVLNPGWVADAGPETEPDGHPEAEAQAEAEAEPTEAAGPEPITFVDVDHEAPGLHEPVDGGPPTAPVAVVDLGGSASDAPEEDDAFLTELRKAMADEEPLGPRDEAAPTSLGNMFDDDDRRGWRFGKRR